MNGSVTWTFQVFTNFQFVLVDRYEAKSTLSMICQENKKK